MSYPNLELETELLRRYDLVVGVDEVGRGAIAGPVSVGAAAIGSGHLSSMPPGVRDSKLVSEPRRAPLADAVSIWADASVGHASNDFIDEFGIVSALASAALSAISQLRLTANTVVLLDGNSDWLTPAGIGLPVVIRTKADRDCGCVAGASLVAKVARDAEMSRLDLEYPSFGWGGNKGYASPGHIAALQSIGPSVHHRISWLGRILSEPQQLF